jgi:hypothetical protein
MNVVEAVLQRHRHFVVLVSGIDTKMVDRLCRDINTDLAFTYFPYLDLPLQPKQADLVPMMDAVDAALKGPSAGVLVAARSFPADLLTFRVDYHVNLSVNRAHFEATKALEKYGDNDFYDYKKHLETNRINKYINVKSDTDLEHIANLVFYLVIDSIEKKVYKKDYEEHASKMYLNFMPGSGDVPTPIKTPTTEETTQETTEETPIETTTEDTYTTDTDGEDD